MRSLVRWVHLFIKSVNAFIIIYFTIKKYIWIVITHADVFKMRDIFWLNTPDKLIVLDHGLFDIYFLS